MNPLRNHVCNLSAVRGRRDILRARMHTNLVLNDYV